MLELVLEMEDRESWLVGFWLESQWSLWDSALAPSVVGPSHASTAGGSEGTGLSLLEGKLCTEGFPIQGRCQMEWDMWRGVLCLESGLPAGEYEDGVVLCLEEGRGPCRGVV